MGNGVVLPFGQDRPAEADGAPAQPETVALGQLGPLLTVPVANSTYQSAKVVFGAGIDPTGVTDSASAIQAILTAAGGRLVYVPDGTYKINVGLTLPKTASLLLSPGATFVAGAVIAGPMLTVGDDTDWWREQIVSGGKWDCSNNAQNAIYVRQGLNSKLRDIYWKNPTSHGVIVGSPTAAQASTSMLLSGLTGDKTISAAKIAGSYGIWIRNCNDSVVEAGCTVIGAERSVRCDGGNNTITVHGYGLGASQIQDPTAVCSDNGSDNTWRDCMMDAPSAYGVELTANAYRAKVLGGHVFITTASADNVVIGVHTALATPNQSLTIEGLTCTGPDNTHRLASDYDGTFPSANLHTSGNFSDSTTVVTRKLNATSNQDLSYTRLAHYGAAPVLSVGTGMGTSPPTPTLVSGSTDARGGVTFGSGITPTADQTIMFITWAIPFPDTNYEFTISPRSKASQALGLYVLSKTASSVQIIAQTNLAASVPADVYTFDYSTSH